MFSHVMLKFGKSYSRLETMGSPALGQGSNCKLEMLVKKFLSDFFTLDSQGIFQMLINLHNCCLITASIAVVWCCTG
jgi:hypothetical protein